MWKKKKYKSKNQTQSFSSFYRKINLNQAAKRRLQWDHIRGKKKIQPALVPQTCISNLLLFFKRTFPSRQKKKNPLLPFSLWLRPAHFHGRVTLRKKLAPCCVELFCADQKEKKKKREREVGGLFLCGGEIYVWWETKQITLLLMHSVLTRQIVKVLRHSFHILFDWRKSAAGT